MFHHQGIDQRCPNVGDVGSLSCTQERRKELNGYVKCPNFPFCMDKWYIDKYCPKDNDLKKIYENCILCTFFYIGFRIHYHTIFCRLNELHCRVNWSHIMFLAFDPNAIVLGLVFYFKMAKILCKSRILSELWLRTSMA